MAARLLSDTRLRAYLDDVRAWHGYVRFLGLPTIQYHPDTPLSDLFVAPLLSQQRVSPESSPDTWPPGRDIFSALHEHPRLVVLGDPGSGKSMIVNWLAWLLAGGGRRRVAALAGGCFADSAGGARVETGWHQALR